MMHKNTCEIIDAIQTIVLMECSCDSGLLPDV